MKHTVLADGNIPVHKLENAPVYRGPAYSNIPTKREKQAPIQDNSKTWRDHRDDMKFTRQLFSQFGLKL